MTGFVCVCVQFTFYCCQCSNRCVVTKAPSGCRLSIPMIFYFRSISLRKLNSKNRQCRVISYAFLAYSSRYERGKGPTRLQRPQAVATSRPRAPESCIAAGGWWLGICKKVQSPFELHVFLRVRLSCTYCPDSIRFFRHPAPGGSFDAAERRKRGGWEPCSSRSSRQRPYVRAGANIQHPARRPVVLSHRSSWVS